MNMKKEEQTIHEPMQVLSDESSQKTVSPVKTFFKNKKNRYFLVNGFVVTVLIVGLIVGRMIVNYNSDDRSQAAMQHGVKAYFDESEIQSTDGEILRSSVMLEPIGQTNPSAAQLVFSYDSNAVEVLRVFPGKDFSITLQEASIDDQSGVVSIILGRDPTILASDTQLLAATIEFKMKPESLKTQVKIDRASMVTSVGCRENTLVSLGVLKVSSEYSQDDSAMEKEEERGNLRDVPGKITQPLPSPISSSVPNPSFKPRASFEPIPPQL